MRALRCRPPLHGFGLTMLGPVLLEYGNEEQKQKHLRRHRQRRDPLVPGLFRARRGSDLAGLQSRAVLQGDHFLVNGHKIWTSYAHYADCASSACCAPTRPAKKHEGISFILVDMNQPGVRARPIRLISGASVFCETFIENVQVPRENLVGEMNKGWTIAKRLLEHERKSIGGIGDRLGGRVEKPVWDVAKQHAGEEGGRIADPALRTRVAAYAMDARAFALDPPARRETKPRPAARPARCRRCSNTTAPS
jgi:alkylation response protein AidB-like acyl-CoA dehydrogenase